jgi:hypothetical protein
MKRLFTALLLTVMLIANSPAESPPREQASTHSKFLIRRNPSDANALILSPEKKSIGVVFIDKSHFLLIASPALPYVVVSEIHPNDSDLAWVILSTKSGLIDCVVISRDHRVSFASPEIIELLRKNEQAGKEQMKTLRDDFKKWSESFAE